MTAYAIFLCIASMNSCHYGGKIIPLSEGMGGFRFNGTYQSLEDCRAAVGLTNSLPPTKSGRFLLRDKPNTWYECREVPPSRKHADIPNYPGFLPSQEVRQ